MILIYSFYSKNNNFFHSNLTAEYYVQHYYRYKKWFAYLLLQYIILGIRKLIASE